jgi:hypothetical protein
MTSHAANVASRVAVVLYSNFCKIWYITQLLLYTKLLQKFTKKDDKKWKKLSKLEILLFMRNFV